MATIYHTLKQSDELEIALTYNVTDDTTKPNIISKIKSDLEAQYGDDAGSYETTIDNIFNHVGSEDNSFNITVDVGNIVFKKWAPTEGFPFLEGFTYDFGDNNKLFKLNINPENINNLEIETSGEDITMEYIPVFVMEQTP